MIRALIADDHPFILKGLRQAIAGTTDVVVAGEAGDGEEALCRVRAEAFDVVVLDLNMPRMSGIEVLSRLRAERPALPVLVLSMHPEDQYAARLLQAGAAGYLTKAEAPRKVVEAIRRVAQGRKFFSAEVAEGLAAHFGAGAELLPHERLSEREFQVMLHVARGRPTHEIAAALSLSPSTVRTYRGRVREKMGTKSGVELALYAVRAGLLEG